MTTRSPTARIRTTRAVTTRASGGRPVAGPGGRVTDHRPGRGARLHAQGGENVTEVARVPETVSGPGRGLDAPGPGVESFPFDLDLGPGREGVRVRARRAGLPAHRVVDLVLAVGEATANT